MAERTVYQSMPKRHVVHLGPNASVWEAACLMSGENVGSVLIVETNGALRGILTERDLMTRVLAKARDPKATKVTEVMTANPVCVPPETPVSDAVVAMIERGFRHLPVVGPGSKILGVFSVRDALPREIGSALAITEFNERVNDATL